MMRRTNYGSVPALLAVIPLALVGVAACSTDTPDRVLERNKELVRRMNLEVWNRANLDAVDELYSPDFVLHFLPDGSETRGPDGIRDHVREHREAFPDWSEDIQHIVAEGHLVVIHFVSTGTNQGPWLGNPPTGRRVRLNEVSIFRIDDGRIAEQWLLPDLLSMQQQLAGPDTAAP